METIKKYLNYLGLAVAAILGIVVLVLRGKNAKLEASNTNMAGKLAVGKDLNELEKQNAKANDAERDYHDVVDKYRNGKDDV